MKKALYTFLLWDLFLFATGLNDLVFLQKCYIVGKRNGGRLGATSFCKCYFISDFAFNLLWIAPTPLWEEFLFEAGS